MTALRYSLQVPWSPTGGATPYVSVTIDTSAWTSLAGHEYLRQGDTPFERDYGTVGVLSVGVQPIKPYSSSVYGYLYIQLYDEVAAAAVVDLTRQIAPRYVPTSAAPTMLTTVYSGPTVTQMAITGSGDRRWRWQYKWTGFVGAPGGIRLYSTNLAINR